MILRWISLVALILLALPGMVTAQEAVIVQLDPMGGSGVSGTAILTAAGDGTDVALDVEGLPPSPMVHFHPSLWPGSRLDLVTRNDGDFARRRHSHQSPGALELPHAAHPLPCEGSDATSTCTPATDGLSRLRVGGGNTPQEGDQCFAS